MTMRSSDGSGECYGYADGRGSGQGCGYSSGYGDGFLSGGGVGDGAGPAEYLGAIALYDAYFWPTWGLLKIGREIHTLDEWIENADEIGAKHGDGIAHETRALAIKLKLKTEEVS